MSKTEESTLQAFDGLLEEERAVLLAGDLEGLHALHDRKAALIRELGAVDPTEKQSDMRRLQGKVERNQALLDGALTGIRSVARRLATVRKVRQTLETYGKDGVRASVQVDVKRSVEKRA